LFYLLIRGNKNDEWANLNKALADKEIEDYYFTEFVLLNEKELEDKNNA
jgi:hypothetical protein